MAFHINSIFYKYHIVKAADEMGVDLFLELTGSHLVPSRRALKKWRLDIEAVVLPMPMRKTIFSGCEHEIQNANRRICLAKKGFHQFSRGPQDLSNFIRPVFKRKLAGEKLTKAEIRSLELHGLIHADGEITPIGNSYKVVSLTTKTQCTMLNIPFHELRVGVRAGRVEHAVMGYLRETTDLRWFFIENYIYGFFVQKLTRSIFDQIGLAVYHQTIDVISRDLEAQALELFTLDYFSSQLEQFEKSGMSFVDSENIGFTGMGTADILQVYRAMGYERFRTIITHDFKEPIVFSRGWPDLLGLDGETIRFVEVKQNDTMTVSQIETFPRILAMGLSIDVYKVQYGRTRPGESAPPGTLDSF